MRLEDNMSLRLHFLAGWILVIATLGLVAFYLPPAERTIGESYLIFFFHFPSAVSSMLLFVLAGIISVVCLLRGSARADRWAASAVEVGVLACTVTLVTGSIWAKAAWGVWWDASDPRLMTVAIMWLTYLGYVALRTTIDEPVKRARFSAVFGILAALNVPLVYFAIRFFGAAHHPMQVVMSEGSMVLSRWFGAGAFLVLYSALWRLRVRLASLQHEASLLEAGYCRAGI